MIFYHCKKSSRNLETSWNQVLENKVWVVLGTDGLEFGNVSGGIACNRILPIRGITSVDLVGCKALLDVGSMDCLDDFLRPRENCCVVGSIGPEDIQCPP
jgi:hypothetical protein